MSAPVPVAQVIDTLSRGGGEQVLVTLANHLDPARYRSNVIFTRYPGPLAESLAPSVCTHDLKRYSRFDLAVVFRFAQTVRREGIRIVHAHSRTAAYFAEFSRRISGGDWRIVVHDHFGPVVSQPLYQRLDAITFRNVAHYFAVSQTLAEHARTVTGIPAARCEYLANPVRLPDLRCPRAERGPRFTVVQVGRIVPDKNHVFALRIAAELRQHVPDLRWIIVGRHHGQDKANYAKVMELWNSLNLQGTVEFAGEQSDVQSWLAQAHVGVLTSRFEGLPISLLEYMAHGLPVVTTTVGQCQEVIDGANGGTTVPVDDVNAFSSALLNIAEHRDKVAALGESNRAYIAERFDPDRFARRVMDVYDEILS